MRRMNPAAGLSKRQKRERVKEIMKEQRSSLGIAKDKAISSLNIGGYLKKERASLQTEMPAKQVKFVLTVQIAKKAMSIIDLPEAKKKAFQKLFLEETKAVSAIFDPISKKDAGKIIDRIIQAQKQALSEASKPTEREIEQANYEIRRFKETKREMLLHPNQQATINRKTAQIISDYYDWLYGRLLGEKNYGTVKEILHQATMTLWGEKGWN